jgi:hypothetical protein
MYVTFQYSTDYIRKNDVKTMLNTFLNVEMDVTTAMTKILHSNTHI